MITKHVTHFLSYYILNCALFLYIIFNIKKCFYNLHKDIWTLSDLYTRYIGFIKLLTKHFNNRSTETKQDSTRFCLSAPCLNFTYKETNLRNKNFPTFNRLVLFVCLFFLSISKNLDFSLDNFTKDRRQM